MVRSGTSFMRIWAFCLFLLLPFAGQGQTGPNVQFWTFGKVFLTSGDTLSGRLSYYRDEEVIKIDQAGKTTYTFTPVNLTGFVVKDDNLLTYREYRTYLWNRENQQNGYRRPAFFEVLENGNYSLLKRETYIMANQQPGTKVGAIAAATVPFGSVFYNGRTYHLVERFYILMPDETIVQLDKPKKDLPYLFGDKARQMQRFIEANNLSYNKSHDLKAIIRYFNTLL